MTTSNWHLICAYSYREYYTKHNENTRSRISSETFWISQPEKEMSSPCLQSPDLAGQAGHGSLDLTVLSAGQRALEFASSSGQDVTSNVNDDRTLWRYTQEFSGTVLRSQPTFLIGNWAISTSVFVYISSHCRTLKHCRHVPLCIVNITAKTECPKFKTNIPRKGIQNIFLL